MNLLLSMFCLGGYTLLAQMLVTRELAVVCLGNELTIGIVFSVWLVLMGVGARCGTLPIARRVNLIWIFIWLTVILPLVMLVLRLGAGWVRPPGEYVALDMIFVASCIALCPLCIPAGLLLSRGCETLARRGSVQSISGVYAIESLGSFVAGVAFSFWLSGSWPVVQIALMASAVGLLGAACLVDRLVGRLILLLIAALLLVAGWSSPGLAWEWRTLEMRWASLGVTQSGRDGQPAVTLMAGLDSRYQNLALVESEGQYTLYADGEVAFSFPDDIAYEQEVNFVMAQKPEARRILLLGGNPAGELPQLLKFPVAEIVWVERDPAVEMMVRKGAPQLCASLDSEPRLKRIFEDGPGYVKRCRTRFDIVLVHTSEPVTGGQNRLYTREFYQDVNRILAPGGFLHTSIGASERLGPDAARVAGSIYRSLQSVFPTVLVTAGTPLQFVAAAAKSGVSLDRDVLYGCSCGVEVMRQSFRPEYFLGADELDPVKIAFTEHRLIHSQAPANTINRPVSCYYTLILWSRYSGSSLESLLRTMSLWRPGQVLGGFCLCGGLLILVALVARRNPSVGLTRFASWQAMAVTGFCGVALELILLYAFQGLHGYVYSRMGFMVGLFMLGAVGGAWWTRAMETARWADVRRMVMLCLVMMVALAGSIPLGIMNLGGAEWLLYGLTLLTGAGVAMQFIAVSRLMSLQGASPGMAASRVWLADYVGSALGGVIVGVLLVPVLGLGVTCGLLAMVCGTSLMVFAVVTPRHRE